MDLYRDEILDHYKHPHNFGDLPGATASYEEYNPLCGDRIVLQLKMENDPSTSSGQIRINDVKFRGEGCAISTASASMMTDYLVGKSVNEVKNLKGEEVLKIVGLEEISPGRLKCALLSFEALKKLLAEGI